MSTTPANCNDLSSGLKYELDDFAYDLPDDLIAQVPAPVRHQSRLLHLHKEKRTYEDKQFSDLESLLNAGDVLVVNDTRVIPARILAQRQSGGLVEILLLRPQSGTTANPSSSWHAMATPIKRLKVGETLQVKTAQGLVQEIVVQDIFLDADGFKRLLIDLGSSANVYKLLSHSGFAPLPPYIHRQYADSAAETEREPDLKRYQTVFARTPGAVAAPTAGLHFSDQLLERLEAKGVQICQVTLHVGPGTFKPITSSLEEHTIEKEVYSISAQTANIVNQALAEGRRIIAVGTTSCRALESAVKGGQLQAVADAETGLYIYPGFQFQIVKGLITNFHLSRSSLLVLVSAFAGRDFIMQAYKHAIDKRYRFFSYGDAMFIA